MDVLLIQFPFSESSPDFSRVRIHDFRNIINQLQAEVSDLKNRVTQLESKQGSWLDRVFKN